MMQLAAAPVPAHAHAEPRFVGVGLWGHPTQHGATELAFWEVNDKTGKTTTTHLNDTISCTHFGSACGGGGGSNGAAAAVVPAGVVPGFGKALLFLVNCACLNGSQEIIQPPTIAAFDIASLSVKKIADTPRSAFGYIGFAGYKLDYDAKTDRIAVVGPNTTADGMGQTWDASFVMVDPKSGSVEHVHGGPRWLIGHYGWEATAADRTRALHPPPCGLD